uniref:Thioredoxin domain-containing protein n=1 Tax=Ditylenchus dipsaci TaxID=166011 RepID=A0A915ENV5_9BILA
MREDRQQRCPRQTNNAALFSSIRSMIGVSLVLLLLTSAAQALQQPVTPATGVALGSGVTELNINNLDMVLKSAQVVFVAFCADWCPFSRRLRPVFEEAAEKWQKENPTSSVVWALVDSVAQADVADKFFVNKYPTMKVFINGELITKEYRSTRSVEALMDYVKKQLEVSINEFPTSEYLTQNLDKQKRNVIAYYHCRDCVEYQNFQKVAALLREDCAFWVGNNQALTAMKENMVLFKDPDTQDEQKCCSRSLWCSVAFFFFSAFLPRFSLFCKMGAVLCLFVLSLVATGVAYHLGYLDVYIEQAKQKINQQQQQQ